MYECAAKRFDEPDLGSVGDDPESECCVSGTKTPRGLPTPASAGVTSISLESSAWLSGIACQKNTCQTSSRQSWEAIPRTRDREQKGFGQHFIPT